MVLVDDAMAGDVAHWKAERQLWQGTLEWLKSGKMKRVEPLPEGGRIDRTAEKIEDCERYIAELEALIAEHSKAK